MNSLPDNPEELYNFLIDLDEDGFENLVSSRNDIDFVIVPQSGADSDVDGGDSDSEERPSGFVKRVNVECNIGHDKSQKCSPSSSKKQKVRHWEKKGAVFE